MNQFEIEEHILKERLKAWIYMGVEIEIELWQLRMEQTWESTSPDDREWNKKRIRKLETSLKLVNDKIAEYE